MNLLLSDIPVDILKDWVGIYIKSIDGIQAPVLEKPDNMQKNG
jgi:hypothetical protein